MTTELSRRKFYISIGVAASIVLFTITAAFTMGSWVADAEAKFTRIKVCESSVRSLEKKINDHEILSSQIMEKLENLEKITEEIREKIYK